MGATSFLKGLFSTSEIVKSGVGMVDNAFFTDQEKSAFLLEYLKSTAPMNISRRFIAVVVTAVWAILIMLTVGLILAGSDKVAEISAFMGERIDQPFNIVLGLYFLTQTINRNK